jgi:hypothetical protein
VPWKIVAGKFKLMIRRERSLVTFSPNVLGLLEFRFLCDGVVVSELLFELRTGERATVGFGD